MRGKRQAHVLLFTRLALYTGARTGAILDLTWDRVDFDTGLIDFRVPGRRLTKKRRTVTPMTRKLRRMLKHAKRHARGRHVVSWAGERIDRVAKSCIAHAERVGIAGFSPHVLRHTFASWAVQRRVPIFTVGKALGRPSPRRRSGMRSSRQTTCWTPWSGLAGSESATCAEFPRRSRVLR
jgi:integrase